MIDVTLDTGFIIDLTRSSRGLDAILAPFANPAVSHVVLGELLLGCMKSNQPLEKNRIFQALEGVSILDADATTASIYARLRWRLEMQGAQIPENDLWIAAVSVQLDRPLVTRDQHFSRISELAVVKYGKLRSSNNSPIASRP